MAGDAVLDEVADTSQGQFTIALRRYQADGSGDQTLATGIPNDFPPPSPAFETARGVVMYALSDCDGASAWVITPGQPPRRLSDTSVVAYRPHLSPDGGTVAWVSVKADGSDLVLAAVDGSRVRTALAGASGMSIFGWSPDGTSLAVATMTSQPRDCAP